MIWIDKVLVSKGEPGVYGEKTLQGFRVWDPYRSKLSALYYLGKGIELEKEMKVLYLGAANGTTVSHVADYTGCVYAVEFAPRPMQDLLAVAKRRKNVIPIMADATRPRPTPRSSKRSTWSTRMLRAPNRRRLLSGTAFSLKNREPSSSS